MAGPAFQTEFASRLYIVANLFNTKFQTFELGGKQPRVVFVMPSTEASTEGGKLARATINLKGLAGKSYPPLSAGYYDVGNDTAVLNSYEAVYEAHMKRDPKAPFHLDRDEYEKFVELAKKFLEHERFAVSMKASTAKPPSAGGFSMSPAVIFAIIVGVMLAGGGAAFYFLKMRG